MPLRSILSTVELILSFVGTAIAGTIYFAHLRNVDLPCSTGNGCDLVNSSHWAHLFGLPVALLGVIGYAVLAVLSVAKLFSETPRAANILCFMMLAVTLGGVGFSWYLQYVAAVYIGAFCIWCRASAITMTLLFLAVAFETIRLTRNRTSREPPLAPSPANGS